MRAEGCPGQQGIHIFPLICQDFSFLLAFASFREVTRGDFCFSSDLMEPDRLLQQGPSPGITLVPHYRSQATMTFKRLEAPF